MKIISVSEFSNNKINFGTKKNNKKNDTPHIKTGIKAAAPTAALVLAMLADPIAVNKAEAQPRQNNKIELHNPQNRHHIPPHHPAPRRPAPHPGPHPAPHHYHPNYVLPTLMILNYINSMAYLNNAYNSPVSAGGVTINKNDITAFDSYLQDDITYNNVVLSDGTSVTYPNQSESRYPMIYKGEGGYVFEGLSNAFIAGTSNSNRYTINGCNNTTVDVGDDNRIDRVTVKRSRVLPNGVRQYSKNIDVMAGRGDIINNQRIINEGTYNFGL